MIGCENWILTAVDLWDHAPQRRRLKKKMTIGKKMEKPEQRNEKFEVRNDESMGLNACNDGASVNGAGREMSTVHLCELDKSLEMQCQHEDYDLNATEGKKYLANETSFAAGISTVLLELPEVTNQRLYRIRKRREASDCGLFWTTRSIKTITTQKTINI